MKASTKKLYKKWQLIIDEWKTSGLSMPNFAKERNIRLAPLKYYRQKLKSVSRAQPIAGVTPGPAEFEPVNLVSHPSSPPVSKRPAFNSRLTAVKVTLKNGVRLEIPSCHNKKSLLDLMEVLQQC